MSSINQNVTRLLQEMNLVHLEIAEALVGNRPFRRCSRFAACTAITAGASPAPAAARRTDGVFQDILQTSRLHLQTAVIVDALVNPFAGKPGLLQNVLGQIAIKGQRQGTGGLL